MIDGSTTTYISPPVLKFITNEELIQKLSSNSVANWDFCKYPCHTVAVKRTVKLVTEASSKVCGMKNRDNHILATLASKQNFNRFDTKQQFPMKKTI